MCIQNALQQHILDITNDGKDVANFLYATMHGQNPNAKFHHQMEAAKHLTKLALHTAPSSSQPVIPAEAEPAPVQTGESQRGDGRENLVRPEPVEGHAQEDAPSPLTEEGHDEGENREKAEGTSPSSPPSMSAPVTDLDIINYKVARLIREETNDGYLIAEFLSRVMHGAAGQGRPISEADRLRAATELLNRGLGRFGDTRDRRISNTQDDRELINSGLSRYIREHTDHGLGPARFLLDVASGQDEGFSMHQRVTATRELIRRGWDTNCDAITPDDIAAYYERQEAREPTGYDNRLQEWREKERAAQEERQKQLEDEPQLEAGLFSHLSFAEIDRYEAMSAEEQAEFVEKQRQYRAARRSSPSVIPPQSLPLAKAGAGIQKGDGPEAPSSLTGEGRDGGENPVRPEPAEGHAQQDTPSPLTGEGRDGGENPVHLEPRPELVEGPAQHTAPSPSTDEDPAPNESGACDRRENPENINWNTLPQDDTLSTNAPPLTHPVKSQTHIRSP